MSTITDEVANLVQHAKDLGAKIGHELSDDAKTLWSKVEGQLEDLHHRVADDAGEDVAEIKGDAANLSTEARSGQATPSTAVPGGPTLTPSAPPHPSATVSAGVPVADMTGTQIVAATSEPNADATGSTGQGGATSSDTADNDTAESDGHTMTVDQSAGDDAPDAPDTQGGDTPSSDTEQPATNTTTDATAPTS